jgi:hypothetical protein
MYAEGLFDCNWGHSNWVSNVKKLLCDNGFAEIFNNDFVDSKVFSIIFKRWVTDTFKQEWAATLEQNPVLFNYNVKLYSGYESYHEILPRKYKYYFCRLRSYVHILRIKTGKCNRNNTPRERRYCLCCKTLDIEDEYICITLKLYALIFIVYDCSILKSVIMLDHLYWNLLSTFYPRVFYKIIYP